MKKDEAKKENSKIPIIDFDGQWKDLIIKYGEDFIKFFRFFEKFCEVVNL